MENNLKQTKQITRSELKKITGGSVPEPCTLNCGTFPNYTICSSDEGNCFDGSPWGYIECDGIPYQCVK